MFFLTAFSVRKVVSLFGTINHRDTSAVVTSQQKIITKKYLILIRCKQTCVTNGYSLGNLLIKAVKEMFSKHPSFFLVFLRLLGLKMLYS